MISGSNYPVTSGELTLRFEKGKVTLYDRKNKVSFQGNQSLGYLLKLCDGNNTINNIFENVKNTYKSISKRHKSRIETVLASLQKKGIIQFKKKSVYRPLRIRKSFSDFPLTTVYIEPTRKCNLQCIHCYASSPHYSKLHNNLDEMSLKEILCLLDKLDQEGVTYVCFTGGEPFFHPNILEILYHCYSLGMEIGLFTNGTLLSNYISDLKQLRPRFVAVSLDSYRPEIYARIRKKDYFTTVVKNITNLIENGVNVRVNSVVFKGLNDSADDICGLLKFLKNLNLPSNCITFDQFSPEGMGADKLRYLINEREVVERIKSGFTKIFHHNIGIPSLRSDSPDLIENNDYDFCGLGKSMLNITSSGNITLCPALREKSFVLGNLHNDKIINLWNNSALLQYFRNNEHIYDSSCYQCAFVNNCYGGCKAKAITFSGSFNSPDRWLCAYYGV